MRLPWNQQPETPARRRTGCGAGRPAWRYGAAVARLRCHCLLTRARARLASRHHSGHRWPLRFIVRGQTIDQMAAGIGNIDLIYEAPARHGSLFDRAYRSSGETECLSLPGCPARMDPTPRSRSAHHQHDAEKSVSAGNGQRRKRRVRSRYRGPLPNFVPMARCVRGLITGRFKLEQFESPIRNAAGIKNIIEMTSAK